MDIYEKAAGILLKAKKAVAFTGAGVSAESGIPTFRDPGGIWEKFEPEEIGTVPALLRTAKNNPDLIRRFLLDTVKVFEKSKANPAHLGVAKLEALGIVASVITQNIDGLHIDAGSQTVFEVHGSLFRARCLSCGQRFPLDRAALFKRAHEALDDEAGFRIENMTRILPSCTCGGLTRPDVVMFGESVQQLEEAFQATTACDVMLILGTSGVVYPAAACPEQAYRAGAKLIEINPRESCFGPIVDVFIKTSAATAMPLLMQLVESR
ncbi:MAG: NAD-dependent deacylase [Deltaproteobacteria bacterium]|nr:NAD-dependent deacylase [Deltaproteobacteria bacterium]